MKIMQNWANKRRELHTRNSTETEEEEDTLFSYVSGNDLTPGKELIGDTEY